MKKSLFLILALVLSLTLFGAIQNDTPVSAEPAENQTEGLIGWWNFNDTVDSIAEDSSTSNKNGTLNNMSPDNHVSDVPEVCSDTNVSALSFNPRGQGDEQWINMGSHEELRPDSITVSAWINAADGDTFGQIAGASGFTKGAVGYSLYYSAEYNYLEFAHNNGYATFEAIEDFNLEGVWSHVAATYDAASGDTNLYINGALVDSEDQEPAPLVHEEEFYDNSPYDFEIGRAQYTDLETAGYFEGLIDDVRVYDYALSDLDIESLSSDGECATTPEDLNGDEIDDSEQPNVGGYVSSLTGKTVAIDVGSDCELTTDDTTQESNLAEQDPAYDYSNGLWEWEADCVSETTTVKLYYYDVAPEGLVARKFSTATNSYFTLTDATIEQQTINGQSVTVVTYSITDNSERDMNPDVGSIADPVGVGSNILGAPQTGAGGTATSFSLPAVVFVV